MSDSIAALAQAGVVSAISPKMGLLASVALTATIDFRAVIYSFGVYDKS